MAIYMGSPLYSGNIRIGAPVATDIDLPVVADDVRESFPYWMDLGNRTNNILYFWIFDKDVPVGQIFLHDINDQAGEALIGYHLFQLSQRNQGIGAKALLLLIEFVQRSLTLKRLVIITSKDNIASQKLAMKCGFVYVGGAREDPKNTLVYELELM